MIVETSRLFLSRLTPDDLSEVIALDGDPDVMRYIGDGTPRTSDIVTERFERMLAYYEENPGLGLLAARLRSSGDFMGWAGLKHLDQTDEIEVGYRFHKRYWGNGYATEAAAALLRYGFEKVELPSIVGVVLPGNIASRRVLEKIGIKPDGPGFFYGCDLLRYLITRDMIEAIPRADNQ